MSQRIVPEKDPEEEIQDIHGLVRGCGSIPGSSLD
jgi:hypothetical protein